MENALDNFYLQKEEPIRSCLLAMREIILSQDADVSAAWKYGMPFFCYKGKMFCYLWVHKKHKQPYIGFVEGKRLEHADLIIESRSRMKILLIDANKDLPIKAINALLKKAILLYKTGVVKLKK
jgi:hypothetical protein